MSLRRYAVNVRATFNDVVVFDSMLPGGVARTLGAGGADGLPTPKGLPFAARILWDSSAGCTLVDGAGDRHDIARNEVVHLDYGPLSLRFEHVERFALKRIAWVTLPMSMVWLCIVMLSTTASSHYGRLFAYRCEFVKILEPAYPTLPRHFPECEPSDPLLGREVDYAVRMLTRNFDGEERGALIRGNEADADKTLRPQTDHERGFVPAGQLSLVPDLGGGERADEVTRRTEQKEASKGPSAANPPLHAPDGDVTVPQQTSEDQPADAPQSEPHKERNVGVGLPDWMDQGLIEVEEVYVKYQTRWSERLVAIDPDDPENLAILGLYQYLGGEFDGAIETWRHFIDVSPGDATGYTNLAIVYKRLGDYDTEEALYRIALSLRPADVTVLTNLALNLAHQNRFDEALAVLAQLDNLVPGDPYVELHRAKVLASMGRDEMALLSLAIAVDGHSNLGLNHKIEFRQDIRLDPSFKTLRHDQRFRAIVAEHFAGGRPGLE